MTSRADLHCHSTASQLSRLGVQRSLGLPECATPPQEVYELAKRRGMDFVTITDHDTIEGALELEGLPDTFVSEELTVRFAGEPQAVHVLCYGITLGDHEWLQAHAGDVEACAAYLHENGIACALAHPFFNVAAPLTRRHRRRLAELFPVWEVRNGSRAAELNMPAAVYVDTRGGTGIGGSDDHAGVDIGRTWTEVPAAATPEEFLAHLRDGHAEARGEQGSAAKWTHAAMALATRALDDAGIAASGHRPRPGRGDEDGRTGDRARARRARARSPPTSAPRTPAACSRPGSPGSGSRPAAASCSTMLQADGFSHADLYRRARRRHERRLRLAVDGGLVAFQAGDLGAAASGIFEALVPAVPYAPSIAFLGAEKAKLRGRDGGPPSGRPDRRRDRLDARRHPHDRADPRAWRPRLRRRRDRHRPRRRPPPARRAELELPFYSGHAARRPRRPRPGRGARRRRLRPGPRHRPRPGRDRGDAAGPDHRRAAARQLPHRARHLRRAARRRDARGGRPGGSRRLLQRPGAGPLAEPGRRRLARRARHRRRQGRPLGARGGRRALRPGEGRPRRLPGRDQGPLRGPALAREGGRPARRRPSSAPTRPTRACTCCWRAAGPRRRSCARASATPPPSSAGSAARSSRSPTRAPTSSSSAASPTPTAR